MIEHAPDANAAHSTHGTADEARVLRNVIAHIPYVVFWKDINSVYLGCNDALARIAGLDKPSDIVGRDDFMMPWSREQAEFFRLMDRRVMDAGEPELNIEESQLQVDGRERVILTSKVPLRDEADNVVGILGIFTDITERKELEAELRRAKEAAEVSARAKSDFLAVMSHELRTPLTLILSPLESLLDQPAASPEQLMAVLESVYRNASRLKTLTDDILDFSKHEAGRAELILEPVDVAAHLAQLVRDLVPSAEACGLTLELTHRDSAPGCALVDIAKLDKILVNLLGNALKFTPSGGRISVCAELDEEAIVLAVRDTGIGIDPQHHERLFRRFEQIDGGSTRRHGGTGLGLSLVKVFAELMGGSVTVESALGRGATFTVRLPRRAADSSASTLARDVRSYDARAHTYAKATPQQTRSHARSVVIAEDNPELRQYLAELLSDELNVIAVADGQLAYDAIREHMPDVVVSDVMMPVMDGFELVQKLKSDPALAAIPIVLLTARAGAESAADSLDRGADDYLSKPFSPIDLRARVRAACRMKALHEELLATQRRAAEMEQREALRETQAALADVSKAASLAEMAAALAHEVNQPLAGVGVNASACLRWLDRDPHDIAEAKHAAQRIARDAKRAADVVNRIRKLFAKSSDARRPLDINDAAEEVVALTRSRVQRAGAALRMELTPSLPLAQADRVQLQQVMVNLVVNAAEAMETVHDRERVIVLRTQLEGERIRIEVRDAGVGIAPEACKQIFRPFYTTKDEGMGMGLSICSTIVENHGETLAVSSNEGLGSTFHFSIPLTGV